MTVQQIDTFLATHWLSEDGWFVPYVSVTSGNASMWWYHCDCESEWWEIDTDGAAYAEWLETKWEIPL